MTDRTHREPPENIILYRIQMEGESPALEPRLARYVRLSDFILEAMEEHFYQLHTSGGRIVGRRPTIQNWLKAIREADAARAEALLDYTQKKPKP